MGFLKQLFNNVPEALTLNNPDEETASGRFDSVAENKGTQSGDKMLPLLPHTACRRHATIQLGIIFRSYF